MNNFLNKPVDWPWTPAAYALYATMFAAGSIALTGFEFGTGNNVYHIPFVLNLAARPEFSGDAFYSSLNKFTSIIWPLMCLVADESNVRQVFYIANFVSRAAAFAAILFLIRTNGLKTVYAMTLCMFVIAVSPWLQGVSVVGWHGMFISTFTHSETAWPFIFLSLVLVSVNRLAAGAAMTGLTFSINAFIGIWLAIINLISLTALPKPNGYRQLMKAALAFFLLAAPAIGWIAFAVGSNEPYAPFSYREYIRNYFPNHFLIEAASWRSLTILGLLFLNGFIAAQFLAAKRYWTAVQLACLMIFVAGIPLPYLFDNRLLFDLCLLRSSGVEQAIATVLVAVAGTKLLLEEGDHIKQLAGVMALLSAISFDKTMSGLAVTALALSAGLFRVKTSGQVDRNIAPAPASIDAARIFTVLALTGFAYASTKLFLTGFSKAQAVQFTLTSVIFAIFFYKDISRYAKATALVCSLCIFCAQAGARDVYRRLQEDNKISTNSSIEDSWNRLVTWIKSSDAHGLFLGPVNDRHFDNFQLQARRKVWVDWKQGAAVMWSPSFYHQWMPRYKEVSSLEKPTQFVEYARAHGVPNVVIKTDSGVCPAPAVLRFETPHYVFCQLRTAKNPG